MNTAAGVDDGSEDRRSEDRSAGDQCAEHGRSEIANRHQLVPYSAVDGVAARVLPFVREGIAGGEHVVVAARKAVRDGLMSLLGKDSRVVDFLDPRAWYQGVGLPTGSRSVDTAGLELRLVGEPPYLAGTAAERQEWIRCEAAANVSLPFVPGRFACLYDVSRVAGEVPPDALRTHPFVLDGPVPRLNPDYAEPQSVAAELDRRELTEPQADAAEFWFDEDSFPTVRHAAADLAERIGLTGVQVCDLSLAVTELATNAVCHGGGRGRALIWLDGPALVCEICDEGPGLADPLVGYLRPHPGATVGGWGLWLARRVGDLVELRTGPAGTVVRLRVSPALGVGTQWPAPLEESAGTRSG